MSLFKLDFKALWFQAFEVMACQYLGTTDRKQSHVRTSSPFHMFTTEQTGGEEKIRNNKTKQNKVC